MQFAKTQTQENTITINLNRLLSELKNELNSDKISFINDGEDVELKGRPTALKRSFGNVIQNALIYGNKVYIYLQKGQKELR